MATDPNEFFNKLLPFAQQAREETGLPVSVILAQWAVESGFEADNWVGNLNYAGITKDGGPAAGFREYASTEEFTKDYISTLQLSYYDGVRQAAAEGAPVAVIAETLGRSPWDAAGYTDPELGYPGSTLLQTISSYNLLRYEAAPEGANEPAKDNFGEALQRFLNGTDPNTGEPETSAGYWSRWGNPNNKKELATLPSDGGFIGPGAKIDPGKAIRTGVDKATTAVLGDWWKDKTWWAETGRTVGFIVAGLLVVGFALWILYNTNTVVIQEGGE
jgi:hypothetical protein